MREGNSLIIVNSLILYIRLMISSIVGLFVTRMILKNLGLDDFGIFMIVGGVVSIIGFLNTVMTSSSNRFITYELAKGSDESTNRVFNVSFNIHVLIAIFATLIGWPVGEWYIINYLNIPQEKLLDTLWVFRLSILGSLVSFIGVPYIGLLIAREKFLLYSIVEIIISLAKLFIAILIGYIDNQKLVTYAFLMAFLTAFPTLVYFFYSRKNDYKLVKYEFVNSWNHYKEIFNFSCWVGYGALATIGKSQGANLIVNYFFGVAMNAALGISNAVNAIIITFATTVSNAVSPQITKSYAIGNMKRTEDLVIASSKYTFFLLLVPTTPLFLEIDFILNLWLVDVPSYTSNFIRLMLIDALIGGLNAGIPQAIFASGKIKLYQLIINTVFLLSLPIAFIVLRITAIPEALLVSYIGISFFAFIIRQILLKKIVGFNINRLLLESYLPSTLVVIAMVPLFLFYSDYISSAMIIPISMAYVLCSIYFLGLKRVEREYILNFVITKLYPIRKKQMLK